MTRRLLPLLVAGLAVAGLPADAVTASAVAGTTVVTAGRSGSVAVRLPRPVAFDVYQDVDYAPVRGRLVALVLKRDGEWDAPSVMAVHPGFCAADACTSVYPRFHLGSVWAPGTDGIKGTLPAGSYRLYVVTDGAPVTVTLKFRGLSGTRRLAARAPVRAAVVAAAPTVAEPPDAPALFAGGSTFALGDRGGMHAVSLWKEVPHYLSKSAAGLCFYDDGAPPPSTTPAYQTPCSGGRGDVLPSVLGAFHAGPYTTPYGPGRFVSAIDAGYLLAEGDWGIGGYHHTPGPVSQAHVHQVWLAF